jgi:hypothetical protein
MKIKYYEIDYRMCPCENQIFGKVCGKEDGRNHPPGFYWMTNQQIGTTTD